MRGTIPDRDDRDPYACACARLWARAASRCRLRLLAGRALLVLTAVLLGAVAVRALREGAAVWPGSVLPAAGSLLLTGAALLPPRMIFLAVPVPVRDSLVHKTDRVVRGAGVVGGSLMLLVVVADVMRGDPGDGLPPAAGVTWVLTALLMKRRRSQPSMSQGSGPPRLGGVGTHHPDQRSTP